MKKTVLHFSGGKDSLACLHLMRDVWDDITVVWQNSGAAFPETLELMDEVAAMVPDFQEVKSDVLSDIKAHGWPADSVPTRHTVWGKKATGEEGLTIRPWTECCAVNCWLPMHKAMIDAGVTTIYRGQRTSEDYKSPVRDGDRTDGILYRFPIQEWSGTQVDEYLKSIDVPLPTHYAHTSKSLDCWCCTAYLEEKKDQLDYLKKVMPDHHSVVMSMLSGIRDAVRKSVVMYG